VASRFYRWCKAGVWDRIWAQVQSEADQNDEIDWEVHLLDGMVVRATDTQPGQKTRGEAGAQVAAKAWWRRAAAMSSRSS
jgi:hypothetical protein